MSSAAPRQRTQRRLRGGVFVGAGASACIFQPPLAREGDSSDEGGDAPAPPAPPASADVVGRVATRATLHKTVQKSALFAAVDPAGEFGLYALGPARALRLDRAGRSAGSQAELERCVKVMELRSTVDAAVALADTPLPSAKVVSKDAAEVLFARATGGDLGAALEAAERDARSSAPERLARLQAYVAAFANLVRGLATFTGPAGLLVMGDIKPPNIVIASGTRDAPRVLKFIDFDDARRLEDVIAGAPMLSATFQYLSLPQFVALGKVPTPAVRALMDGKNRASDAESYLNLTQRQAATAADAARARATLPTWLVTEADLVALCPYAVAQSNVVSALGSASASASASSSAQQPEREPLFDALRLRVGRGALTVEDDITDKQGRVTRGQVDVLKAQQRIVAGVAVLNDVYALCAVTLAEVWAALAHARFVGHPTAFTRVSRAHAEFRVEAELLPRNDAARAVFQALEDAGAHALVAEFVRDASCFSLWPSHLQRRFEAIEAAVRSARL